MPVSLKRIFAGIAAGLIILHGSIAFADLQEEQRKLERIRREQKKVEAELNNVKKQKSSLIRELERLNNQLNAAESKLDQVEKEIEVTRQELDKLNRELEEAIKKIEHRKGLFNQRLRNMYKNGSYGYLDVLLQADNFSDLISRFYIVSKVASYDLSVLEEMKEYRDQVEEKRSQVKQKEVKMLSLKNDLISQKKEVQALAVSRNKTLQVVKSQEQMYKKMLDELERTSKEIERTILRLQSSGSYVGGKFVWPAPGYGRITSNFGWRIHPIYRTKRFHSGIDIGVPWGGKIVAAASGKVIYADWYGGYGKTVMIDHGGGIVTLYAHNSRLKVKAGAFVKAGDIIALAGSTGLSTGPHLHFEVRKNGKPVNPLNWVR